MSIEKILEMIETIDDVKDLGKIGDKVSIRILEVERELKKGMFVDRDIPSPLLTNEQYNNIKECEGDGFITVHPPLDKNNG